MRLEAWLLSIGLGFALLGQYYFAHRREYVWDGLFFWGIAVLAFALLMRRMSRRRRRRLIHLRRWPAWGRRQSPSAGASDGGSTAGAAIGGPGRLHCSADEAPAA